MTDGVRVQRTPAERRDQILDAAGEVFAAHGLHQARIDDIAAAAGVSKGTVYWYFPSKDEIILALVDAFYSQAQTGLEELRHASGPVAERLHGYLRSYDAVIEQDRLAPLALEFYALAYRQQRVRDSLERYYAQWSETAAALLDQGNERGEFDIADTQVAARTLVELLDGAFLVWAILPETVDLSHRMQTALDLLIHGLAGNTARTASPAQTPRARHCNRK